MKHMKMKIMKNYLGFIEQIRASKRRLIKQLFQISSNDSRTTTGANLRNILLLTDEPSIDCLSPSSVANLIYKELDENDWWKVQLAHEIIDMKEDISVAPVGWEKDDLNFILTTICTD